MTFYQELQLNQAGSKNLLKIVTNKKQNAIVTAIFTKYTSI